jgi:hypothetical protein
MRQKLESLGWVENRNIRIEYRWAGGDPDKTGALAKELIGHQPSHGDSAAGNRRQLQELSVDTI